MRAVETFNGLGSVATMTASTTSTFLQNVNAMRASSRGSARGNYSRCSPLPPTSPHRVANRMFNAPNVRRGYPAASAGFGGLGAFVGDHLLCPEVDDVVNALKSAVAEVRLAGPVAPNAATTVSG